AKTSLASASRQRVARVSESARWSFRPPLRALPQPGVDLLLDPPHGAISDLHSARESPFPLKRVDGRTLEPDEFLDLLPATKAQRLCRGSRVEACKFSSVSGVWGRAAAARINVHGAPVWRTVRPPWHASARPLALRCWLPTSAAFHGRLVTSADQLPRALP